MNAGVRARRGVETLIWMARGLTAFVALLVPIPIASAQSPDAEALYQEALAAMDAHDYTKACPGLERVVLLRPGAIGAKLELATCYEAQDKLASAFNEYSLVQRLATASGQERRREKAAARARDIEARLAFFTLVVSPEAAGLRELAITMDEVAIPRQEWGRPIPIDAGKHTLSASAPGRKTWSTVVLVEKDGVRVSVRVETPVPAPAQTLPKPKEIPTRSWQRPLAFAALETGALGIAVGGVLGVRAIFKNDESNRGGHCLAANRCDEIGYPVRKEAIALADASTATIAVGAAALAASVVLFATAPKTGRARSVSIGQRAAPDPGAPNQGMKIALFAGGLVLTGDW